MSDKIQPHHLLRLATVYVRQSSDGQVQNNRESYRVQIGLTRRAEELGWAPEKIQVIDGDQGTSASQPQTREDEGYERFYYPLGRGLLQYIVQPYFKNKEESQFPPQPDKLKHMRLEGDMELFLHQLQPQSE